MALEPSNDAAKTELLQQQPETLPFATTSESGGHVDVKADVATESDAVPIETVSGKWPGWPGDNVFRLIVPVLKVGSIIGRKGELIKKMCDETRARIRVLEGPVGTSDRIVLVSGKEDPDAPLSPAMEAAVRVFKRVSGMSTSEGDGTISAAAEAAFGSIKLLVASPQAINLIGKQGSTIKSIQENSGASLRVLPEDELPAYATSDERIVEIQGQTSKVLKALEAVLEHLRKFLVDHSVVPIFEKTYNATISQDRSVDTWVDKPKSFLHATPAPQSGTRSDYSLSLKREPSFFEHETLLEPKISHSGRSFLGQDPGFANLHSTGPARTAASMVTQVKQTMQVPLSYAEDIIGIGGSNIAYIRRTSGAILTIQESRGLPDEITVEIKGTSSQVQMAQQLIQEFIGSSSKEPTPSMYGKIDTGLGSYSHFSDAGYPSSSYGSENMGGYGSSGVGGYSSYRF